MATVVHEHSRTTDRKPPREPSLLVSAKGTPERRMTLKPFEQTIPASEGGCDPQRRQSVGLTSRFLSVLSIVRKEENHLPTSDSPKGRTNQLHDRRGRHRAKPPESSAMRNSGVPGHCHSQTTGSRTRGAGSTSQLRGIQPQPAPPLRSRPQCEGGYPFP